MKTLSILGSTGSIGQNTLTIVSMFPDRFRVKALAAKKNISLLSEQIKKFCPDLVSVFDSATATALKKYLPKNTAPEILYGDEGYSAVATHAMVDTVVSAMVGAAGLSPTIAAIEAGKDIALANKETLVMAGDFVMALARKNRTRILPVDSEHSAIFQCISGQRKEDVVKIFLTASGGPFLDRPVKTFRDITPADALKHPNWDMGKKISVDSATLMNKGLEVIEAKHLLDIPEEQIEVIIHPQSLIHSMVSYQDGSVLAQLGVPDMKSAIAYALSCPERLPIQQPAPDFTAIGSLDFRPPDLKKFPCLDLAFKAGRIGGTLPAVLNAANETAVTAFLNNRLPFSDIPKVIGHIMDIHTIDKSPGLSDIKKTDKWARQEAEILIKGR